MPRKRRDRVRRTSFEWAALIKKQEASELTIKEFCEREGLARSNFNRWRLKASSSKPARFVELKPAMNESSPSWEIEVALPHGVRLRFRG